MSWVKFQTKLKKEVYFYLIVFCSSKLYEEHFFVEFSLYPDVIPKFLDTEILSITRPNCALDRRTLSSLYVPETSL